MLTVDYSRLGIGRGDLVLDLGAGGGRHSFEAVKRGARTVALDLDPAPLRHASAMIAALNGEVPPGCWGGAVAADALRLPFPDGKFDAVIASEVLEHIPDDRQAMAEVARVTRPGGRVAVTVPRFWPEAVCWLFSSEYHSSEGGHVRIYRLSQLVGRLRDAGLRPDGIGFAHALHAPYWWLRCLVGPHREDAPAVRTYRRFLEWDIMSRPRAVRLLERSLDPMMGKSLVVYLRRPKAA